MIENSVLDRIRAGIVAIGFIRRHWKEALLPTNEAGPDFNIIGTGFLVEETTVISNRHVVQGLEEAQRTFNLDHEQLWLSFVFTEDNALKSAFVKIDNFTYSNNPALDIGFIEFALRPSGAIDPARPLTAIDHFESLRVSQRVAVCGYPYGTGMLRRGDKTYRFGPVLQQGFISAISPYDGYDPDELLLDLRTAKGMSGSPVFLPDDGTVIGIHYAGWEATTALAIPVSAEKLERWLREHDKVKQPKLRPKADRG